MIKRKVMSIMMCVIYFITCISLVAIIPAAAADAFTVTSEGKSTLSAILINDGGQYSEINYDYNDIRGKNEGDNWTYTINVEAAGTYNIKVLGSSGWNDWSNDANGRFKLEIGETVIENGTAVLPAIGGGGEGQSKDWGTFTEDDALDLGNFELASGIQTVKVTVITPGTALGVMFKNFYFTPVSVVKTDGTPYGGTAPEISSTQTTVINAAEKNIGANGSGGTVVDDGDYYDIRSTVAGEWWTYTINVPTEGKYDFAILGSGGYHNSDGRFTLTIDDETIVDGTGDSAVVLPISGDGGFAEDMYKALYFFDDTDKTELGEVTLGEGEHVIKITVDVPSSDSTGIWFKKLYFTPVIEETDGTPWGGEALTIAARSKTTLYAAKKNENAAGQGVGGVITDTFNDGNTVETAPEKMDIRGKNAGEWWTYTVDVEEDGTYAIETLATSGECLSGDDNGSRFTLTIDDTVIVDGTGDGAVVLPVWNNDKAWYQFADSDKTDLGEVELTAGEHVIKVTVNTSGDTTYGMIFSRFYFTPVGVELSVGEPYGGTPVTIADGGKTVVYAARKNTGDGMGGTIKDSTGNNYTVENHPECMDIRGTAAQEWWAYTVNVEKTGLFKLEILGSSGYAASASQTDGGGRFTLKIDDTVVVDGTGDDAVVLPPLGDGTENGSNKWWHDFGDADKVDLGLIYLEEGTHNIKISVDVPGNTFGVLFKRLWFTSVPLLDSIVMNDSITIARGEEKNLTYTLNPAKAQAQTVTWSSSDSSVCTVDENGKITGVSVGTATITVSIFDGYQTVTKDCTVTVNVAAESVTLSQSSITLTVGNTATVTETVLPADTSDKTVLWQSSNTVVAGVSNGVITARAAGSATITATCGSVQATVSVTVTSSGGGGGGSGSGGSGGGGGFKHLPTVTDDNKTQTTNNTYTVTDGQVKKLDSNTMKKILSTNDTIKYNVSTNSLTAVINGEFFTENPTSKSMVYAMAGGTVEIGADALNKAGVSGNGDVTASLGVSDSVVKVEISAQGKLVSDFNGAVRVKLPADICKDYTVTANGGQLGIEYVDNMLVFAPVGSGTYDITSKNAAYEDADNTAWATDAIYKAVEKNVLQPVERGSFGAGVSINRGELVSAIVKALGLSAESGTPFEDVPAGNKYFSEITTAKKLGIVNGVDGKNFLPDSQITRQDMSVVIYNALKAKGSALQSGNEVFSDDSQISDYAKEAVYLLAGAGFVKGRDTGFAPLANMTRAEAAVLLSRICGW